MAVDVTPSEWLRGVLELCVLRAMADGPTYGYAIAADLAGFGRSDKPADVADHSYARHVEWIRALAFDQLDLHRLTLVGQDWGGLIGLRLLRRQFERAGITAAGSNG